MTLEDKVKLWDLINKFVESCGGKNELTYYGGIVVREKLVVDIESHIKGMISRGGK